MRDLCNSCRGLGCVECGLQGTVEVPEPAPAPVHAGPIDPNWLGVPAFGAPVGRTISLRDLYSAGTEKITIEGMPLDPGICSLTPSQFMVEHERVFRLRVITIHPAASPGGRMHADFELVPC